MITVFYNYKMLLLIIIINLFSYNNNYAQSVITCYIDFDNQTDCAVRVLGGGSVDFRINSLGKYNDGVIYDSWTKLVIHFEDDPEEPTGNKWKLEFRAISDSIYGGGGRSLDLDFITLEVVQIVGDLGAAAIVEHEQALEDNYVALISNADQGIFDLYITYKIGKGSKILLGEYPGYYVTDIQFKLSVEE